MNTSIKFIYTHLYVCVCVYMHVCSCSSKWYTCGRLGAWGGLFSSTVSLLCAPGRLGGILAALLTPRWWGAAVDPFSKKHSESMKRYFDHFHLLSLSS